MARDGAIRLRVLGPVTLEQDGVAQRIASPRQRRILAVLVAAGGRAVSADRLIDAVWDDRLPAHPHAALQTQLSRVRTMLDANGRAVVRSEPPGYALALDTDEVDAWHFEALVGRAGDAGSSIPVLRDALSLWDGDAFADVDAGPALVPAVTHLEQLRANATEALAAGYLESGDPEAALAAVEPLLAREPHRDRARAVELRALSAAGRATEALRRYQDHRARLVEDLGVEPSPILRELEHDILDHRLPVAENPGARGTNLRALPVSSFVGREHELGAVDDLLRHARVVSIVGPGGAGKTRLALHAAHRVRARYPDGMWWCDLASASAGEVATLVASCLRVHERRGQPHAERIAAFLGSRRSLLVVDNCEHVVTETSDLLDRIVRAGTEVDVLATSRQPLTVDGEHQLRLGSLALPSAPDAASPAVALFLDRAHAAAPGTRLDELDREAVADLCRRVGGLPLAIELAAACTTRIDVAALAQRVGDQLELLDRTGPASNDRRRSLRGVLESSYELLEPEERTLLDRLPVFASPFDLHDVEALAEPDGRAAAGRALGALVDKSMVLFRPTDGRYELLPPVHTFAASHVTEPRTGDRLRHRHARVVIDRARRADAALRTAEEPSWCEVFDDTIADLRKARAWLLEAGELDPLVELCTSLHWFAMLRTRSEPTHWARETLARLGDGAPVAGVGAVRACAALGALRRGDAADAYRVALHGAGAGDEARFSIAVLAKLDLSQGRLDTAIARARDAADQHREAGDPVLAVDVATVEAAALAYSGDLREARSRARALTQEADGLGVPSVRAMARYVLAEGLRDPAIAVPFYHESIRLARTVRADFVIGLAGTSLAARELQIGRTQDARLRLGEVIDHWQRSGVRQQQWLAIRLLIEALDRAGDHASAATLAGAHAASTHAAPVYGEDRARLADVLEDARSELGDERYAAAEARGAALTDDQAAGLACSLARAR